MTTLLDRVATLSVEKRQLLIRQLDPLSFIQERLWFLHQLAPEVPVYNIPLPLLLSGPIRIDVLARSLAAIEARHEILRTTFPSIDGQPVQHVGRPTGAALRIVDLEGVRQDKESDVRQRVVNAEVRHVFDVERGPLWRRVLIRVAPDRHVLMVTWHHLIYDGWSRGVFLGELAAVYESLANGKTPALAPLAVQYRHFARLQRGKSQGAVIEEQFAYWRTQLAGELPVLDLPSDRPRPSTPSYRGADEMFALDAEVVSALRAIGREGGITLFMALLAGWVLLLQKYCGARDAIVGTVTSGRSRPEFEALIGCFVNTLALRVAVRSQSTSRDLLRAVRETALGAYAHQDLPFERLVNELQPERRLDQAPLFRTWVTLENTPSRSGGGGGGQRLGVQEVVAADRTAKFDLSLTVKETPAGILGPLRFATDLFDRSTVVRLTGHLRALLEGMAARPDACVSDLSLLTESERTQVLQHWNAPCAPSSGGDRLLVAAFEAQVERISDAIALTWRDTRVTYAELNRRANQVADHLRSAGVGAESLVAVCLERSIDLVVALLGTLKAGAGYVPLDPTFPAARLSLILEDIQPRMLVAQESLRSVFSFHQSPALWIDTERGALERCSDANLPRIATSANVAYAIYTSGSTGRPKGVLISHGALRSFLDAMDRDLAPREDALEDGVWLATTSASFDISVLELLWTLTRGMQVVVQAGEVVARPEPVKRLRHTTFSLFYFASDADAQSGSERYRLLLDGARFADSHGFSSVWMPERHFHSFGGIYPNPSVTAAAVAAITTRVKIRAGSVVLPLHDPIRVAEEWAVVDNLSDGRVGLSFASGWHANDFVLAPERYQTRRQAMVEMMEVVQKLWRGEAIARRGPTGQDVEVRIRPRPVQPSLPVWITSSGSPDTFRQAGAIGANLLTHLLGQTVEELAGKIELYREAWRAAGHAGEGHVTLMLHTFIGDDRDDVRQIVRGPFSSYLRDSAGLLAELARSYGSGAAVDTLAPEDLDALVAHAFDRYFETSGLFGTPTTALETVTRLQNAGVDEIGCLVDFGVDAGEVLRGLHHLARLKDLTQAAEDAAADLSVSDLVATRGATHLQCTPTWARLWLMDPSASGSIAALRAMLVGGEALPATLAADLCSAGPRRLYNMYGPTETTIWSSSELVTRPDDVTLGRPLANTQLYVLDRDGQLVPPGIPGEIHIGGDAIARGYWKRPDLTADRFAPDPFGGAPGARIYRTGDRGRWRADGRIEFLGRVDHQVKLRGRRIELREIEAVLRGQPGVREAVVLLREDAPAEPRLVAYAVLASGTVFSPDALQQMLRAQLPDYMVPSVIVALDAWPMTPSGKIDRRALPKPSDERPMLSDRYVAPRTPAEAALCRVWGEVLRIDRVGIHDNFFALGGDSILSLQVVARAMRAGWRLAPRQLFEHQTVAALAQVAQAASGQVAVERAMVGAVPLLPIQSWFFELPRPAAHHYNQQVLLEMAPSAARVLEAAWAAVVAHHDALRVRFTPTTSGWTQAGTRAGAAAPIPTVDMQGISDAARRSLWERVATRIQASLDLEQGPLARPVLLVSPAGVLHLFVVAHHLVIDGVSWRVLLADLQQACRQLTAGEAVALPPKTSSVRQWAEALRALAASETLTREVDLWARMSEPAAMLPPDLPAERNTGRTARTVVVGLGREETQALIQDLPGRGVGQIQELLLTALVQSLADWTGEQAWRIDLEGHGRELPGDAAVDVSRTIGWFTSLYPVRIAAGVHPFETLRAVKTTLRAVPNHGIGYGVLRYQDDRPETEAVRTGRRAEIIFNYLGQVDQVLEPGGAMRPARLPVGLPRDRDQPREYVLEINGIVRGGALQMAWTYSGDRYRQETMEAAGDRFIGALRALVSASRESAPARPWLVPADFPLADVTAEELEEMAAQGPVADVYPLSPMQQGLLFHSLYAAADRSSLYTIQFHSRVEQDLDVDLFRQAWQQVAARHAILRTGFAWTRPDQPLQVVYDSVDVPCVVEDWRGVPPVEQEARASAYITAEQRRGFDLRRPPLMRIALLRLGDRSWQIVWTAHHLIVDGWSVPLVMGEALRTYYALAGGGQAAQTPAGQYRDYIAWVQRQDLGKAEAFWRRTLDGFSSSSLLAADSRQAIHQTVSKQTVSRLLPAALVERLHALGRAHALTLNTWLVGAWALVLAHYTRKHDVVFGSVVSGRPPHLPDVERTIGVFVNTLPVRAIVAQAEPLIAWLAQTQRQQIEARDYEHTPLGSIQTWSAVPAATPLFDTLFIYENYPVDPVPHASTGAGSHDARVATGQSGVVIPTTYPLVVQVEPSSAGVNVELVHDAAAVPAALAQEILARFEALVQRMASQPDGNVGACLELLDAAERHTRADAQQRRQERNRSRLRHLQRA